MIAEKPGFVVKRNLGVRDTEMNTDCYREESRDMRM